VCYQIPIEDRSARLDVRRLTDSSRFERYRPLFGAMIVNMARLDEDLVSAAT
jgi:hypothetical protein